MQNTVDYYSSLVKQENFYISILENQIWNLNSSLNYDIGINQVIFWDPNANENLSNILISIFSLINNNTSLSETVVMSWSDVFIKDKKKLVTYLEKWIKYNESNQDKILLCWIKPEKAIAGFWYIETSKTSEKEFDSIFELKSFKEKPNQLLAEKYVKSWNYLWNSWIFIFKLWFFWEECKLILPWLCKEIEDSFKENKKFSISKKFDIPVDTAIFEKSKNLSCMRLENVWWSDVWSFTSFHKIWKKCKNKNIKIEKSKWKIFSFNSNNNLIISEEKNIIVNWLSNIVVIENWSEIYIWNIEESSSIKNIVNSIPKEMK